MFFFVHVSKLLFCQKLNDRVWKNVFVKYENNNFWTIYNLFNKRTQFARNVYFDELQIYYADKFKSFDDSINISKVLKHWIANNDDFLNNLKWSNFFEKNSTNNTANNVSDENNNNSNEQNEKKNVDDDINHLFNNILPIESSFSSIFIDIMFSFDDQSFHDQNIFFIVITVFSVFSAFIRNRIIKSKSFNSFLHSNYKWLNFIGWWNFHMIKMFKTLESNNFLNLFIYTEFQFFWQVMFFFEWPQWKFALEKKMFLLLKNDIWKLIILSFNYIAIIGKWVFKIKHNTQNKIIKYKTKWIVHEYKQQKNIDFIIT